MAALRWLIMGTLLVSSTALADGPVAKELYVRGGFNGWGLDHPLHHRGNGVYETDVLLSPGNHPFKVGHKDWSAEWVIDPARSVSVAPDRDYRMNTVPGPEDYVFVRQTATYRFRIDAADPAAPTLRVTRLALQEAARTDPHAGHAGVSELAYPAWDGKRETARFSTPDAGAALRTYAHSTTLQLRDPGPQFVSYQEKADLPAVRSGSLAFDALFTLAVTEMRQNAVSQIKDGNYNGGAAIPCECFETGEKWHYVWTRDLSYAADLGLALLDPQRVRNSLDFKLSGYRAGVSRAAQVPGSADGLQIIQDTGSGGSWPVSTDRVTWAFGADKALAALPPAERRAFVPKTLAALINTIEIDRVAAFDSATGLYTGEQSFLDWRDQSYAAWIVDDLASMSSARALSTNVAHYKALTLAAALADEQGDKARARRYGGWAEALKRAINARLWLQEAGMYSSLTAAHFDGAPMHKFDWLGQSLAVITGVADPARARSILAHYPHGPMGAPVIYPQQPDMPVYHNRAIWPFVTGYGLRAAARARNVAVADAAYTTLMRGAALNLSNMENLEWLTGQPLLLDEAQPNLIGPVINSRRQLWSVGAYLGMVIEQVFGVRLDSRGIAVEPFITARLRREQFGGADEIVLDRLPLHGHRFKVRIHLPPASTADGYYPVASVTLNGVPVSGPFVPTRDGEIDVRLGELRTGEQAIRQVSADPYVEASAVFGPREPVVRMLPSRGLEIAPSTSAGQVTYDVYRDGKPVSRGVPAGVWTDRRPHAASCYAVEARFTDSGNRSHHSRPLCLDQGQFIGVDDPRVASSVAAAPADGRFAAAPRLKDWGKPSDRFVVEGVRIATPGTYAIQLKYHNAANQINLGISAGVKWLAVKDAAGRVVATQVVQLPHARIEKENTPLVYSTPLAARLKPGLYRLELSDFYNMSYLQSNSSFSAAGGIDGPSNRFDLYGVRILRTR